MELPITGCARYAAPCSWSGAPRRRGVLRRRDAAASRRAGRARRAYRLHGRGRGGARPRRSRSRCRTRRAGRHRPGDEASPRATNLGRTDGELVDRRARCARPSCSALRREQPDIVVTHDPRAAVRAGARPLPAAALRPPRDRPGHARRDLPPRAQPELLPRADLAELGLEPWFPREVWLMDTAGADDLGRRREDLRAQARRAARPPQPEPRRLAGARAAVARPERGVRAARPAQGRVAVGRLAGVRAGLLAACLLLAAGARAQIPEPMGSATLPAPGPHWVWVDDIAFANIIDGRAYLVDADTGRMLGMLSTGALFMNLELPRDYSAIYAAETYYSRGTRGTRTDVITRYDPRTLEPVERDRDPAEAPGRRADALLLGPDRRPALHARLRLHARAVGQRRRSVCEQAGGRDRDSGLRARLSQRSAPVRNALRRRPAAQRRSERKTGAEARPKHERALLRRRRRIRSARRACAPGRTGTSRPFDGWVHDIDVSAAAPQFAKPWSIVSAEGARREWLTGGAAARGGPLAQRGASTS